MLIKERKKQLKPPRERKFDGKAEAHLIALSCSQPPKGYARWSLKLLADKVFKVELDMTFWFNRENFLDVDGLKCFQTHSKIFVFKNFE